MLYINIPIGASLECGADAAGLEKISEPRKKADDDQHHRKPSKEQEKQTDIRPGFTPSCAGQRVGSPHSERRQWTASKILPMIHPLSNTTGRTKDDSRPSHQSTARSAAEYSVRR